MEEYEARLVWGAACSGRNVYLNGAGMQRPTRPLSTVSTQ